MGSTKGPDEMGKGTVPCDVQYRMQGFLSQEKVTEECRIDE